jgi:hypothetical protein
MSYPKLPKTFVLCTYKLLWLGAWNMPAGSIILICVDIETPTIVSLFAFSVSLLLIGALVKKERESECKPKTSARL